VRIIPHQHQHHQHHAMNEEIKFYLSAKSERAKVARLNASARMRGQSEKLLTLPDLPPKPSKYIIEQDGIYMGTEYDREFAMEYAGKNSCTVREIPFDRPA
jgi:hypothetical protein